MSTKSKQLSLVAILFLTTSSLFSQFKHEVKLDLLQALTTEYLAHYELILTKNIGIEAAFGVDLGQDVISNFDFNNFQQYSFSTIELNPSLAGKVYFLAKEKFGRGLYFGPYIKANYLLSREEGFSEKYIEVFNRLPSLREQDDTRFDGLFLGVHAGCKWLIKSRFVIELQMAFSYVNFIGPGSEQLSSVLVFRGEGFLKLGYRFNSKNENSKTE